MTTNKVRRSIEDLHNELKEGESAVLLKRMGQGFLIHIGDSHASNTWAITMAEAECLYGLLDKKLGKKKGI